MAKETVSLSAAGPVADAAKAKERSSSRVLKPYMGDR